MLSRCAIGGLNAVNETASSRMATASARVRGSKLDRKVPGVAMSQTLVYVNTR